MAGKRALTRWRTTWCHCSNRRERRLGSRHRRLVDHVGHPAAICVADDSVSSHNVPRRSVSPMQGEVMLHMESPPQRVWSLVSDITNTGTFSPETFDAEWLDGATGPGVGIRFRGHVRRNGKKWFVYWTACTITKCDPGRDFAFQVDGPGGKPTVKWAYHFEPGGSGTDVTESFEM